MLLDNERKTLIELRLIQADECLRDAEILIQNKSYRSSNNRAYYAMEKAITALLLIKSTEVKTHKGVIQTFNRLFVNDESSIFDRQDYLKLIKAEQIRNVSDYDDYFIPSSDESSIIINDAKSVVEKVKKAVAEMCESD